MADVVEDATTPVADLLTVDGFDADQVMELLDDSDVSTLEKTTLGAALDAAKDNPELLATVLEQLKAALGL